jgi:hypothetical protein
MLVGMWREKSSNLLFLPMLSCLFSFAKYVYRTAIEIVGATLEEACLKTGRIFFS